MNATILNFLSIFAAVFLAELGDKTQLATMLFASDNETNKFLVFCAAAAALISASALSVAAGGILGQVLTPKTLKIIAGTGFIVIGLWTIFKG